MTPTSRRLVRDAEGLNAAAWPVEPDHFVTPVELFFTRSHAAFPRIDAATGRLDVTGLVDRPASYSLDELTGAFPRREVTATLVCAGLRRDEFLALGPLPFWNAWRQHPVVRSMLSGVNAAVVGVLLAALYDPIFISAVRSPQVFALALAAFGLLVFWKLPPVWVVAFCALGGEVLARF